MGQLPKIQGRGLGHKKAHVGAHTLAKSLYLRAQEDEFTFSNDENLTSKKSRILPA